MARFLTEMTRTKLVHLCPICRRVYAAMSPHLLKKHSVLNPNERKILLNLSTGRVNIKQGKCPILGCLYDSSRLDTHLKCGHPELDRDALQAHCKAVKYQATLKYLSSLQASKPVIPMSACTLSLQPTEVSGLGEGELKLHRALKLKQRLAKKSRRSSSARTVREEEPRVQVSEADEGEPMEQVPAAGTSASLAAALEGSGRTSGMRHLPLPASIGM